MATKQEQILKIDPPEELTFVGPFHEAVSSTMMLINPSKQRICFKIKTTAPEKYSVKPKSGVIDPKKEIKITLCLQPFDFDPRERNCHRFKVLSICAPVGEFDLDEFWKNADSSLLMDSKLKCVLLLPDSYDYDDNGKAWQSPGLGSGNGNSVTIKEWKKMEKMLELERLEKATQDITSDRPLSQESNVLLNRATETYSISTTYMYVAALFIILGVIGAFCFQEDISSLGKFIATKIKMKSNI